MLENFLVEKKWAKNPSMNDKSATNSAEAPQRNSSSPIPKPAPPNHQWLPIVETFVLAGLLAVFVARSILPAWRTLNSEFPNYYLAAALYHRRIPLDRIYEWTWFQRQNDHLQVRDGLVSFAPNPPTLILSLVPFTTLQAIEAKRLWLVMNLVVLVLCLWILRRVTSLNWRRLGLITLLCVLPLRVDFLFGRHYVLILMLICGAYYASWLDRQRTAGVMLAAAALLKLFPGLFLILFVWKRNWRAVIGLAAGATAITILSIFMFGVEVHRVLSTKSCPRFPAGIGLAPMFSRRIRSSLCGAARFSSNQNTILPPLLNSPAMFAIAQAITMTVLVFSFLRLDRADKTPRSTALQWAAFIPLLLLLSTTTGTDYACLLIFSAIVGFDVLLATGDKSKALFSCSCMWLLVRLCQAGSRTGFPCPDSSPQPGFTCFCYARRESAAGFLEGAGGGWLPASVSVAALTIYNLRTVRNRVEDFSWRLPTPASGYRAANPVPVPGGVVFTVMQSRKYQPVLLKDGMFHDIPMSGDVLSVAGAESTALLYSELTGRRSFIVRLPIERLGSAPEILAEGRGPCALQQWRMADIHPGGTREKHSVVVGNRFKGQSSNGFAKRLPSHRCERYVRRGCDHSGRPRRVIRIYS